MKTDWLNIKDSILFDGITPENVEKICTCISARERHFKRDSFVFRAGDKVHSVYMILSGSMHIIDEDFWGNRSIIATMDKGTLFGEAYVFSRKQNQLVSVIAAENSAVLEINPEKLFETCVNGCSCHSQLIKNTLYILSEKVVRLTEKLEHVTRRTIEGKVFSYLSKCARHEKSGSFTIPYSRQQLADYLCVDRSALSHELSKLQKTGRIRYHKNQFELLTGYTEP